VKGTFRPSGPGVLDADAVIVGSGAGGACVADVLTRAGLSVVLLEEGPFVPASHAPLTATAAFPLVWRCGGLTAALGKPPIAYAEGRCVGGDTEINSAIFQRVAPDLLDEWAGRYQIRDFDAGALTPWYERAAAVVNASLTPGPLGTPSDLLAKAGATLGWKVAELERGQRSCVGTNMCSFVCPTAGKQSMSNTLLPQAVARGLRLVAETRVDRFVLRRGRVTAAIGTAVDPAGRRVRIEARGKLFFSCAGAIHTPALLHRSGFRHRVGRSLRLHPTLKCTAVFADPVDAHLHRLPLVAITEFMPDQRIGGSVFTPAIFALSLAEDWEKRRHLMPQWRNCASYYAMVRPVGTGSINVLPGCREPIVRYALAPEDWAALGQASARLGEAMFAAGAQLVIPSITGHRGWRSPVEAREFLSAPLPRSETNLMTIHLFSSCPPGEHPTLSATDSFGRVRRAENLFIADGSAIPEAPGVNPQATIMAMSFRAAEAALGISPSETARAAACEAA